MTDTFDIYALTNPVSAELYTLKTQGRVEVVREDITVRASDEEIAAIASRFGLPPPLDRLFRTAGSVHIEWRSTRSSADPHAAQFGGRLKIPTLSDMFGDVPWAELLHNGVADHGRLFALDKFSAEWWAVLRPGSDRVWLHEVGMPSIYDTRLSIPRWFELGTEARFYEGWLFSQVPALAGCDELMQELEQNLSTLFPFDISVLTR